jgi:3-oxoacyl-[acyl-carrier-protein] synthase II
MFTSEQRLRNLSPEQRAALRRELDAIDRGGATAPVLEKTLDQEIDEFVADLLARQEAQPQPARLGRDDRRRRVVITGLGMISPLGLTVEENWSNLLAGKSGISYVTQVDTSKYPTRIGGEVKNFDPAQYIDFKEARRMSRFSHFAVAATKMALADANFAITDEEAERVGIVLGTGIGGIIETEKACKTIAEKGGMRLSPFFLTMMMPNAAAYQASYTFGIKGYTATIVTACASGTQAIGEAAEVIRRGAADVMVTGGTEGAHCEVGLAGFAVMRAFSTRNDEPEKACRPFDLNRDGFVASEGCGILIIESLEHALQRGARIYAEVLGQSASGDAFNPAAPEPEGKGASCAMRWAIEDAELTPTDIDYINAHGTSTPIGDAIETLAIKRVFGDYAYQVPISSTKSMLGHAIGAAGSVEAIACVLTIRDQIIHPTITYETPDPACDLDYVPNVARPARVDCVLSNSFGLGGQNACLVLGKFRE